MLHLIMHKETDELLVVTHDTYFNVFQTDFDYVLIEFTHQLPANGITMSRLLGAFEKYVEQGVQTSLAFDFGCNAKDETVKLNRVKE